jgi:hypothetical protein
MLLFYALQSLLPIRLKKLVADKPYIGENIVSQHRSSLRLVINQYIADLGLSTERGKNLNGTWTLPRATSVRD